MHICFDRIWDSRTASISECFLPGIVLLPAILAAFILLGQILRSLIPQRAQWMRPFVQEIAEPVVEVELVRRRRWTAYTQALSLLTLTGLILQLVASTVDRSDVAVFVPILTWLVVLFQLIILRPRTVPHAVLWLLIAQCISQATLVSHSFWHGALSRSFSAASTLAGFAGIVALLFMPLRDPFWPTKSISKPFTEPNSTLRSPEDIMNLWQFMTVSWVAPLLTLARQRQLEETDVWSLPYGFAHRRLHDQFRELKGSVIARLVAANAIDLSLIIFLGLLELVCTYSAPVLLQLILSTMQDPTVPKAVPITYSFIVLVVRLISSQAGVFNLWFGRRCYERSRGEMITMLHEKTLGRKIAFQAPQEKVKPSDNGALDGATGEGNETDSIKSKPSLWRRFLNLFARKEKKEQKEPASMGKILNLMRNDVYEVAQRFWEFDKLLKIPLSVVFSMGLVVNYLGWSAMIAVAVVVGAQLISAGLARIMIYIESKRRIATDKKLQIVGQFVEALRHLRWYGWQGSWLSKVLDARQKELNLRVVASGVRIIIAFVNTLSLDCTPVVAFYAYTVIAKKHLTVDIAFPALALFGMMTFALNELPQLITTLINAWVAVNRIEEFMAEPDRQEMSTEALIGDGLSLNDATFAWPGLTEPVLKKLNVSFPIGLSVISGEVASGKTALLQALLGELDMLEGQLIRPLEPIGYCAQTPWLQSMSIRDNILFSEPFSEQRYNDVLQACALIHDLAGFSGGDQALIGENGIGLSGGQRARVALARAVYSQAKILFLDDPLSALDQQTAESIVNDCFLGPLMEGRTVLLVTHRQELVIESAKQFIALENGGITTSTEKPDNLQFGNTKDTAKANATTQDADKDNKDKSAPKKFMDDEHREKGGVKLSVYWEYIKAGKLSLWAITIAMLILFRSAILTEQWFVKTWAESYQTELKSLYHIFAQDMVNAQSWISDRLPPPEENVEPWVLVFLLIALVSSFCFVFSQTMLIIIGYVAGRNMFREIMEKVAYATFRFYDVTPVGRLMNRMTSDIGVIDGGITHQFLSISWTSISWVASVVVIAAITPLFLLFTIVLLIAFVVIFRWFISASQSLRRLETVSLTPLMSNFGALLEGLATVRAFRAQERFQDRVIHVVDNFQKMDHFYWSAQSWITYRYDILSALATFLMFLLALATNLSAGLTAFVLLSAQRFVVSTHSLCRQYGQLQMQFVSVERVVELLHLEQEPKGTITPPAWWPSFSGDVVFDKVTIQYAPHLDPALSEVSFTIKGGSKTAILGRTGSGKSTLALSLIATMLPTSGNIIIDSIDLAEIDKQLLRTRITFLAQDPVLFPGTMRENLDPVSEHTDAECAAVLSRVCARQGWELDTKVEAGGKNLSQGQRQLVGLARAVLRRSAIIILDEATASIDRETAAQIQTVMHEEMKESTVITIAHRLEAVKNADYCIVLGRGRILKQGSAEEMLSGGIAEENVSEEEEEAQADGEEGAAGGNDSGKGGPSSDS
jgi:ABC-type multidrug transport system fused ATPase/permease subunit